jgi:type II secretory ATPase GspE/PulE/Tfp pilus assembly ATPase PilB-like protein
VTRTYLSPVFCATNGIVIKYVSDNTIVFGMLHPEDRVLKTRIEKIYPEHRCNFESMALDEFNLKLSQLYAEDTAEESSGNASIADTSQKTSIDHVADDAPLINLLNSIFLEAISKRASDIHVESGKNETSIRFRIDGVLVAAKSISTERAQGISARLKLLANLNILETRRPQDGHIDITSDQYSLDVRISVTPTIWGESIVLRLLNRSDSPFTLDSLGFSKNHRNTISDILTISSGLVLVTGPTGSGKTTTLAAVLKELNTVSTKIISIEDPVEYRIDGITQIQVNEDMSLTFDAVLRRIFRQDPDIIMVGEIRDTETAELAIRAALTGHLVFATLHTNNALEAIYRLQNMGIPPYMVAAVLRAVIAQRLIRKVCTICKAAGCDNCFGTGYKGRTVIAEIIAVDEKLSQLIGNSAAPEAFMTNLKEKHHTSLFDDASRKVEAGDTTLQEVQRELGRAL